MSVTGGIELGPRQGTTNDVLGIPFVTKAGTEQTRGAYFLCEVTIDGEGPPLHKHISDDEAFYVLSGELTIVVEDQTRTIEAGAFSLVPRNTPHTIRNDGDEPVRALLVFSPGETQQFVTEANGVTDLDQIAEIAGKNGMEILEG